MHRHRQESTATSNIAWNRLQSNDERVEEELMENSNRALSHTADPVEKLRLLCLSRGAGGIMMLGRILRRMDEDGVRKINKEEFRHGIKEAGLDLSDEDAVQLFETFGTDGNWCASASDIIKRIRPPMSESREQIVQQAFTKLDKSGEGVVSINDIRHAFAVTSNPRYMNGDDSAELTMKTFLDHFETEGVRDGQVTLEDFMNYYSGISVSIDSDCFFDLMLRQEFKL